MERSTKGIVFVVISVLVYLLILIPALIGYFYGYNVSVGQYIQLADDASTATKKLDYLDEYSQKVKDNIHRNQARFIFKRSRYTRDTQLQILGSLVQRLVEASNMQTDSFQYQQAMLQITGQEFDHTLSDIDSIFHSCWFRQSGFLVFALWISWLPCLIFFVKGWIDFVDGF